MLLQCGWRLTADGCLQEDRWFVLVWHLFFVDHTLLVLFVLLSGDVADSFPAAPFASWVTCLSRFGSGFVLVVVGSTPSPSSVAISAAFADPIGLSTVTGCLLLSGIPPDKKRVYFINVI